MLSAEGLAHSFGSPPVHALDGISFRLDAGHTLAVFGPNGAGKTTLLKVLAGLIRPQAGRAHLQGGRRAIGWGGHPSPFYSPPPVAPKPPFLATPSMGPQLRR